MSADLSNHENSLRKNLSLEILIIEMRKNNTNRRIVGVYDVTYMERASKISATEDAYRPFEKRTKSECLKEEVWLETRIIVIN